MIVAATLPLAARARRPGDQPPDRRGRRHRRGHDLPGLRRQGRDHRRRHRGRARPRSRSRPRSPGIPTDLAVRGRARGRGRDHAAARHRHLARSCRASARGSTRWPAARCADSDALVAAVRGAPRPHHGRADRRGAPVARARRCRRPTRCSRASRSRPRRSSSCSCTASAEHGTARRAEPAARSHLGPYRKHAAADRRAADGADVGRARRCRRSTPRIIDNGVLAGQRRTTSTRGAR